jgi:sigma-B regulation protein RsbU (phosphoserine phosphatase)
MNQFFSDVDRILSPAANVRAALQRLVRVVVPGLADFCFIFLVSDNDVRCVASAHTTLEGQRLLRGLTRVYKITRNDPVSTVAHVLRTGRPKLRTEISSETAAPLADLRVFTLHRRLGARSALVVPIGSAPAVVGAISLSYGESGRHYTAQDVPVARRLAGLTAAFLRDRARVTQAQAQVPLIQRRPLRLRARV